MTNDSSHAPRRTRRRGLIGRLTGELLVIVIGVLIALAADRWNQTRSESVTAAEYLVRVGEDIRSDSATIERFLARSEVYGAARDSLMAALSGTLELDGNPGRLLLAAAPRFALSPVIAWEELNNTGSLGFVKNDDLRRVLSIYYAARAQAELVLAQVGDKTREPYFEALYPLGLMDGNIEQDELDAFLDLPEAVGLLKGLGGYSNTAENRAAQVLEAAVRALSALGSGSI
jgi:hypothetical protein